MAWYLVKRRNTFTFTARSVVVFFSKMLRQMLLGGKHSCLGFESHFEVRIAYLSHFIVASVPSGDY